MQTRTGSQSAVFLVRACRWQRQLLMAKDVKFTIHDSSLLMELDTTEWGLGGEGGHWLNKAAWVSDIWLVELHQQATPDCKCDVEPCWCQLYMFFFFPLAFWLHDLLQNLRVIRTSQRLVYVGHWGPILHFKWLTSPCLHPCRRHGSCRHFQAIQRCPKRCWPPCVCVCLDHTGGGFSWGWRHLSETTSCDHYGLVIRGTRLSQMKTLTFKHQRAFVHNANELHTSIWTGGGYIAPSALLCDAS